jgi:hypothetical protein
MGRTLWIADFIVVLELYLGVGRLYIPSLWATAVFTFATLVRANG